MCYLKEQKTDPFLQEMDLSCAIWEDANLTVELENVLGGKSARETKVSLIYSGGCLFVRFVCVSDHIKAKMTKPNEPVWEEEAVEFFIQPPGMKNYYFEIDMNPLNTVTDLFVVNDSASGRGEAFQNIREWDCRDLETRVFVKGALNKKGEAEYWIAEMKIPLKEMPKPDGAGGYDGNWKCNMYRISRCGAKPEFQAWNPTGRIEYHFSGKFMSLNLKGRAKAMILAAGFGSRLKELTKDVPKPLIEIAEGYAVIDNVVTQITNAGIYQIAANLHYKGDMIRNHLENRFPEVDWTFFYEEKILETGGGIANAADFFNSDFGIVINSDILSYIDLNDCLREHAASGSLISLVIKPVAKHERILSYNEKSGLTGFYGSDGTVRFEMDKFITPADRFGEYTGIQIFDRGFLNCMRKKDKFSIVDVYVDLVRLGKKVNVISAGTKYWRDMGTPESLEKVRKDFSSFRPNNLKNEIATIDMLFKGASEKSVYRLNYKDEKRSPEVLTVSENEAELKAWAAFSKFFEPTGFKIPRVINCDKAENMRWILMEDGGRKSLFDFFKEADFDKNVIRPRIKKSVDLLIALSKVNADFFPFQFCIKNEFDKENILFDLRYYNKFYLEERGMAMNGEKMEALAREIHSLLEGNFPKVLMHRDYQTTNMLINDRTGMLSAVDIQTMRLGYSFYDLASVIIDNYFPLDPEMIEEMVEYFSDKAGYSVKQKKLFWVAAYIRKVQNLGAFGRFKDNPFFADKIVPAEQGLEYILKKLELRNL
jgi:N-acetyl-alpha-D-muramate 1-phosphate uridylyltransferase